MGGHLITVTPDRQPILKGISYTCEGWKKYACAINGARNSLYQTAFHLWQEGPYKAGQEAADAISDSVRKAVYSNDPLQQYWNWFNVFVPVDHLADNVHGAVDAWRHGDYYGAGAQAAAAVLDGVVIELTVPAMVMPFLGELGGAVDLVLDASVDGALDAAAGAAGDTAAGAADVAVDASVEGVADGAGPADLAGGADGSTGPDLASGCLANSFDAQTRVLMSDGDSKPISQVKLGDKVLATDPQSNRTTTRAVTQLHLNQDRDLADVTVHNQDAPSETIHTTRHHVFWNDTQHAWTPASALRPGDRLLTNDGHQTTVIGVHAYTGSQPMYNLTIATDHTYYVIAGNVAVLVHNDGDWVDPNSVNFSQRTISSNNYAELMSAGEWDWERSPLRVTDVNGQLVSYDNRRLDAARQVGQPARIERVNPADAYPDSTTGKTWGDKFTERFRDPRNVRAGGVVPSDGLPDRPTVC